jgi:hypothetical protein
VSTESSVRWATVPERHETAVCEAGGRFAFMSSRFGLAFGEQGSAGIGEAWTLLAF